MGVRRMRPFVYCLQFQGKARDNDGGKTLQVKTTGSSCQVRTLLERYGVESRVEPLPGQEAVVQSELQLGSDGSFTLSGTLSFGNGHLLQFSNAGQGQLVKGPNHGLNHGSVICRIDKGEGQFEGAQGFIASNFLLTDGNELTDYQFGLVFLS